MLVVNQELVELMQILMDVTNAQVMMSILEMKPNVTSVRKLNVVNQQNQKRLVDLKTLTVVWA